MEENTAEARRVIEKAVWRFGVVGDRCALLASVILDDLDAAGLVISPAITGDQ